MIFDVAIHKDELAIRLAAAETFRRAGVDPRTFGPWRTVLATVEGRRSAVRLLVLTGSLPPWSSHAGTFAPGIFREES